LTTYPFCADKKSYSAIESIITIWPNKISVFQLLTSVSQIAGFSNNIQNLSFKSAVALKKKLSENPGSYYAHIRAQRIEVRRHYALVDDDTDDQRDDK